MQIFLPFIGGIFGSVSSIVASSIVVGNINKLDWSDSPLLYDVHDIFFVYIGVPAGLAYLAVIVHSIQLCVFGLCSILENCKFLVCYNA